MQTEQIDETAEATLTPAKPRGRGARYRPILKMPAAKAAEKRTRNAARPLPDIRALSGTKARLNVPKNFQKLQMVHEYCLRWNEPLPDYRSVDCAWNPTKQDSRIIQDEINNLHDHALAVFKRLARLTRNYQATEAGILKQLQQGASYKVRPHHVRSALKALREAGLVERIPARSATGACGWIVRLKRPSEWPQPFMRGGVSKEYMQAQPGYNPGQGRVVVTKRTGKPFRSWRAADQCILDGITGEVLDKATGHVLFVVVHSARNRWGVARFLGPAAGKLSNKILSQSPHTLYEEIKEEGITGKTNPNLNEEERGFVFSTNGPTVHQATEPNPNPITEFPAENKQPGAVFTTSEDPDSEQPDPDELEFFDDALDAVQKDWEAAEQAKEPGDVDGSGRYFDPDNSRYRCIMDGRDTVPAIVHSCLPDHLKSVVVQAPLYLGREHHYTATIVERWYRNAPEALLVRELTGDDEAEDLVTARLWMRRFVDRFRAKTHEQLYRRLLFIALMGRVDFLREHQPRKTYTYQELKDCRGITRELLHRMRCAPDSLDLVEMLPVSPSNLSPRDIIQEAEVRYHQLGSTWVPDMTAGKQDMSDYILMSLGAMLRGDEEHIDNLIDATNRTWRSSAFLTAEGQRTISDFQPQIRPDMDPKTAEGLLCNFSGRFAKTFRMTPADVENELRRFACDRSHLLKMVDLDGFDMLPYATRSSCL